MEKTLRELAEAVISAHRIPAYEEPYRRETLAANVALGEALGSLQGPHRFDTVAGSQRILAALDAERAAVLEEVRVWLEEYAKHPREIDAMDYVVGDFRRRFLVGKEGA